MSAKSRVTRCFILFALALGLHQTSDLISNINPSLGWVSTLDLFLTALIPFLFLGAERSSFGQHGFVTPKGARRLLTMSLFLGVLYGLIILFLPGGASGFVAIPAVPLSSDFFLAVGSVLLASIAAETIFRGYVQTNLANLYEFSTTMIAVSAMFTLYTLPITLYFTSDSTTILNQLLPVFAESVFLCFLFAETKTLVCPIAFSGTVTLLQTFTPLQPASSQYSALLAVITYAVLIPVMQSFVAAVKEQNARLDESAVEDSDQ
jgi:membrane protease YdiL (CAAX protease family)